MSPKLNLLIENHFLGHKQAIYSLQSDGFGGWFSAGSEGWIVHWKGQSENNGLLIAQTGEPIYALYVFGNELQFIAAGGQSGTIYLFRSFIDEHQNTKVERIGEYSIHNKGVFDFQYLGNHWVCSCSADGRIAIWNLDNPQETVRYSENVGGSIRCIEFNPEMYNSQNSRIIRAGGYGGKIFEWKWLELEKLSFRLEWVQEYSVGSNTIFQVERLPNGYAVAGRDAKIWMLNQTWEKEMQIDAHWYSIHALACSPDLKYLASGSMDKSIRLWDVSSGEIQLHQDLAHRSSVNKILWLSSNRFITCSDDAQIISWKIES